MTFNWQTFLDANHIEYVPGVRGNVEVHCPFCGHADHSHHMSISLEGKGWRCWRNPQHKGSRAARLVRALINCSWEHAIGLTGENAFQPVENLIDKLKTLYAEKPREPDLAFPREFKSFVKRFPSSKPYVRYMRERGFHHIPLALRYATRGDFAGRIIIPVRYRKKLMGWTGRTIFKTDSLRYKDEGRIKNYLPWYDHLKESSAHTLVIVEGPFDALKIRYLGQGEITATCFFTAEPTDSQLSFLYDLIPHFDRCVTLLDRNTLPATMRLQSALRGFNLVSGMLPEGIKDPGELLTREQLLNAINA